MQHLVTFYQRSVPCLSLKSPDIGQNSGCFQIFGQSLIKEYYLNSRTSDDTDMKLVPVTKLDKKNKTTPKKFDSDTCQQILMIYGQFGAIQKLDPRCIVKNFIDS